MAKASFLLLGLLAVGLSQVQSQAIPCCAPKQFTTHYGQVAASQAGGEPMMITETELDAAYDFTGGMVGMETAVHPVNGTEVKYKLIQNFTAGYQWIILASQCIKQPLSVADTPMRCVPDGSTFEGTFMAGVAPNTFPVTTWLIKNTAPGPVQGQQRYTVTGDQCAPFSTNYVGIETTTDPPANFISSGNYLNFTASITDRDRWFKLPPACNSNAIERPATEKVFPDIRPMRFF